MLSMVGSVLRSGKSGAVEVGWALGEERAGALEHVLAAEHALGGVELRGHARVEVEVPGALDQALGLAHRDRPALGDPGAELEGGRTGAAAGDDLIDEADLLGPRGTDELPDEDQLLRARRADDGGQALGAAAAGQD